MVIRYSTKKYTENMARATGQSMSISTKHAVEICSFIRGNNLATAKDLLNNVMQLKTAVPLKRYKKRVAHKKKIGSGRYPIKACKQILKLLESVEANAQFKGLNTANLVIEHICAHKSSTPWHYGRFRGRKMKRTNVEVVVEEKALKKEKEEKVEKKKAEKKPKEEKKKEKPKEKPKEEVKKEKSIPPSKQEETKIKEQKAPKEKVQEAPKEEKKVESSGDK